MTSLGTVLATFAISATQAATFQQTIFDPATSIWNGANMWGDNPVTAGNDYQMVADPARVSANNPYEATTFIIDLGGNVTTWSTFAWVRDYPGGDVSSGNSTFGGDNLLIASGTRFLSKARNTTSTANFVMQDGGFMQLSPGGVEADGPGTSTWDGTISTSGNTLIGLEASTNTNAVTLNIVAPISGSGLLTLTGKNNQAGRLNLLGDISGFTGTFLLSSAATKNTNPLVFSIANSAALATLQLNWQSPLFSYDLSTNDVTFGSVILGTGDVLEIGTYDAEDLNALTGNTGIFTGTGTITVVPEPSTYMLGLLGLVTIFAFMRKRSQVA